MSTKVWGLLGAGPSSAPWVPGIEFRLSGLAAALLPTGPYGLFMLMVAFFLLKKKWVRNICVFCVDGWSHWMSFSVAVYVICQALWDWGLLVGEAGLSVSFKELPIFPLALPHRCTALRPALCGCCGPRLLPSRHLPFPVMAVLKARWGKIWRETIGGGLNWRNSFHFAYWEKKYTNQFGLANYCILLSFLFKNWINIGCIQPDKNCWLFLSLKVFE